MFGYVMACRMELKVKDLEKYKAYYCGVCKSIKNNFGNLPRAVLNYDMTFLAILLDSLVDKKCSFESKHCLVHPIKKRLIIIDNPALDYAAFCNVALAYYKLLDNVNDDNSKKSKFYSFFLKHYLEDSKIKFKSTMEVIEKSLNTLNSLEGNPKGKNLDDFSHPFAELTAFIVSSFYTEDKNYNFLYKLGYNLGKWIYLIDALDDLEKDMKEKKFNPINSSFNIKELTFDMFFKEIENRIDFVLVACASECAKSLNELSLHKNIDLLNNILQFGLMEKMDTVFKRRECENEKSI
jgi:predicted hydrocarbon binding protein